MDADTAAGWCRQRDSELASSVVLEIPTGTWEQERICQAIRALAQTHRGGIKDVRRYQDVAQTHVLFEWRGGIPDCFQKESITIAEGMEAKIYRPRVPKLEYAEAGTPGQMAVIGPEFVRAIGELLEKSRRNDPPSVNFNYRRLRIFSGNTPTPAGEETYDEWVEQATQAMDEWDIPESQRKQRLTESLRGPASEAVRNLKASQRDCTALDYLNILQEVFGQTEKVAELFFLYEHTYQQKGEKMTEYMGRLDRILHRILLKKGVDPEKIDGIRMQQVLRGAQPLDPVMLKLRTKGNNQELKYLELIRTVREEEALLEEKSSKSGVKVHTQQARPRECTLWDEESSDTYGSEIEGRD
uniref:Paraneoplastic antigen Ma-like C-terminal domain-containing protein n=1 Tax=Leptobrachium leishanense TaxID=445787 RepID=A0A8C5R1T4_9ANUR